MSKIKYPCLLLIGEKHGQYVVNISSEEELLNFSIEFAKDKINLNYFILDDKYNPEISFESYFKECYGLSIEEVEDILSKIDTVSTIKNSVETSTFYICLENKKSLKANWKTLNFIKKNHSIEVQHHINTKKFFEAVENNNGVFVFKYLKNYFENHDSYHKFDILNSSNYSNDTNFITYDID